MSPPHCEKPGPREDCDGFAKTTARPEERCLTVAVDADQPRSAAELTLEGAKVGEQRRSPRTRIALQCILRRAHGSPVAARTRDVGPAGMCASTSRPLTIDEAVSFELALNAEEHVCGQARVLREQDFGFYALRFEVLSEAARDRLHDVVAHAAESAGVADRNALDGRQLRHHPPVGS